MATLPQLIEEDIQQLDEVLRKFLEQSGATAALIIDKGGFLIAHQGEADDMDFTTIGALASGAFLANQTIAGLVNEKNFNSIYQQGDQSSMLVMNVDEYSLLVVIFRSEVGVGAVKFYGTSAVAKIAEQMSVARERAPEGGLDLSILNVADPQTVFRKKTT